MLSTPTLRAPSATTPMAAFPMAMIPLAVSRFRIMWGRRWKRTETSGRPNILTLLSQKQVYPRKYWEISSTCFSSLAVEGGGASVGRSSSSRRSFTR